MKLAAKNPAGIGPVAIAKENGTDGAIDGKVIAGKVGPAEVGEHDVSHESKSVATTNGNALSTVGKESGDRMLAAASQENGDRVLATDAVVHGARNDPTNGEAESHGESRAVTIAEEDQLFWARVELLSELADADRQRVLDEQRLAEAKARKGLIEQELQELNAKIPTLSTVVIDSRDMVIDAASRIATLLRERRLPDRKLDMSNQVPKLEAKSSDEGKSLASDTYPEAWRAIPTSVVLDSIVGLGKKKKEKVLEVAPTLGQLEDLRAKASSDFMQFHELLPKGIGENVGDEIDSAMCNHYAEWMRQHAVGAPTSRALAERLYSEIKDLSVQSSWRPSDCELGEGDNEQHHAGFAAYLNKLPFTDMPYSNEVHAKDWIVGWRCAEVCGEAGEKVETASKVEEKTPKKRGRKKKNETDALSPDEAAAAAAAM